jgi:hypothetical protein
MTEYVDYLKELETSATPRDPMRALDSIVKDLRATSKKTLSVFVRDCVGGNCFPIDSRVDKELDRHGLPVNERLLVSLSQAINRNPRQVARMYYEAGGEGGNFATENFSRRHPKEESIHSTEPPTVLTASTHLSGFVKTAIDIRRGIAPMTRELDNLAGRRGHALPASLFRKERQDSQGSFAGACLKPSRDQGAFAGSSLVRGSWQQTLG